MDISQMDHFNAPQWVDFEASSSLGNFSDYFNKDKQEEDSAEPSSPVKSSSPVKVEAKEPKTPVKIEPCSDNEEYSTPMRAPRGDGDTSETETGDEETLVNDEIMENVVHEFVNDVCTNYMLHNSCRKKRPMGLNSTVYQASPNVFKTPKVPNARTSKSVGYALTVTNSTPKMLTPKTTTSNQSRGVSAPLSNKKSTGTTPVRSSLASRMSKSTPKDAPSTLDNPGINYEVSSVRKRLEKLSFTYEEPGQKQEREVIVEEITSKVEKIKVEVEEKTEEEEVPATRSSGGSPEQEQLPTELPVKCRPKNMVSSFRRNSTKPVVTEPTKPVSTNLRRSHVPRILPYQNRRHSGRLLQKPFVGLAEAVLKYQNGTPKRFRSSKAANGAIPNARQNALKLTHAVSPQLMCKTRSRPVTALSREQKEELELKEMRKHKIRANPVPVNTLREPQALKPVQKKPLTVPDPFHLTQTKNTRSRPSSVPDLTSLLSNRDAKCLRKQNSTESLATDGAGGVLRKPRSTQNLAESGSIRVEPLPHFGIPSRSLTSHQSTHTQPFSFDKRIREIQKKKEEKLKELKKLEERKGKFEFHARPVPSFVKAGGGAKEKNQNQNQNREVAATCSSSTASKQTSKTLTASFEERNKQLLLKKEDKIKKILEEDKKARVFHAKPKPNFDKPVMVRGVSSERTKQVKSCEPSVESKKKPSKGIVPVAEKKRMVATSTKANQENRVPNVPTDGHGKRISRKPSAGVAPPSLSTDKRAKDRKEFDEKIRQKELEEEAKKRQREEELQVMERKEKMKLRKMAEVKARPMPSYKPLEIAKSTKPLTLPESPAWAHHKQKQ